MLVFEIYDGDLLDGIERAAREKGIKDAAIVTLIGSVGSFSLLAMSADDETTDIETDYQDPAEMNGSGEIVDGKAHIHAVMALEGDRIVGGHVHRARIGAWFVRAYLIPGPWQR
jgi:uncharacterized protein